MSLQKPQRSPSVFLSTRRPTLTTSSPKPPNTTTFISLKPSTLTTEIKESCPKKGVIIIYNFWLGTGNNSELVRKILLSRGNWNEVEETDRIHFKWSQFTRGYKYDLVGCSGRRELLNHFENYSEVNNKGLLIRNLNEYCENQRINMFSFTPTTFVVNLNDNYCDKVLSDFLIFYAKHHPTPIDSKARMEQLQIFKSFIKSYGNKYRAMTNKYSKYEMARTFVDDEKGAYLWLLKPTELNRGRGVRVFSELEGLRKMVKEYTEGFVEKPLEGGSEGKPTQSNWIKTESFVIQKYIQRPLLINKRKFDIRNWALVDHHHNIYFFKQGYARLSSQQFSTSKATIDNPFIHLTNNAIQQHGANYCKFQLGNQLSFKNINDSIAEKTKEPHVFAEKIFPKMKEIVRTVFKSVKGKLNKGANRACMEIFGLDFFLDEELNVWLIEVNSNPCIEESSPLLGMLIPRMLNDAFKLTVDKVFPKWIPVEEITGKTKILEMKLPQGGGGGEKGKEEKMRFRVEGYEDEKNMWEYVDCIAVKERERER